MINFKKYFEDYFQPMDIIGTTSFGPLARIIWRNTWVKKNPLAFFFGCLYKNRAYLSTHIAITCIGKDGRKWIAEMDNTQFQKRYIAKGYESLLLPEEYAKVEHSCSKLYQEINIYSGLILSKADKYYTNDLKKPHVCWIGRYPHLTKTMMREGNEWIFDKYRRGIPYDYFDIIALWKWTKKLKLLGLSNVYICSEMAQRCYEYLHIFNYMINPMTPKDWQKNSFMKKVAVPDGN